LFPLDLSLLFKRELGQFILVNLVCLLRRSRQDMEQTTLEMLSIKGLVSINSGIGITVLHIGKAFAGSRAGVKRNMNLYPISIQGH
jgi:hypothetical protein